MPDRPDKDIEKTRPEAEGVETFVGTGVAVKTEPTTEDDNLTEKIRAIVEEMIAGIDIEHEDVVGETIQNSNVLILNKIEEIYNEITNIYNTINNFAGPNVMVSVEPRKLNMASGVSTKLDFNLAIYDPDELADTDNHVITVPATGNYFVGASLFFANGSTNDDQPYQVVIKSGETFIASTGLMYFESSAGTIWCSNVVHLTEGDLITVWGTQTSGGPGDCQGEYLTMAKIA